MPSNRAAAPRLPDAPKAYDQRSEQEFRSAVAKAFLDSNQAQVAKPDIQVQASRSSTSATLSITILDEDRRVTAIEFNKREGSSAATGWVSTWDTSSGTIGTDASLTRSESISIPAGLDSSAEWRVKWRDQRGIERTEGGPIPLANLSAVSKTLPIAFTSLIPESSSISWEFENGYLRPGSVGAAAGFRCVAPLPSGVTVTAVRMRSYRNATGDAASLLARTVDNNGNATNQGSVAHSTTGWQTITLSSLSITISSTNRLLLTISLTASSTTTDARVVGLEVDYTTPSYDKTY